MKFLAILFLVCAGTCVSLEAKNHRPKTQTRNGMINPKKCKDCGKQYIAETNYGDDCPGKPEAKSKKKSKR